jgi:YD repeat-containing protein
VSNIRRIGINYMVDITFTSSGTATIEFKSNGVTQASMNVTVNPCGTVPSAPSVTFTVSTNACGNKTITRSGSSPPVGITWYWQSSATGTSTTNSGATYSVSSSGTYYLRAKANCNTNWSSAVPAGGIPVTVVAAPANPAATFSVSSNVCGPRTITLTNAGSIPAGVTWYWQGTNSTGQDMSASMNAALNTYSATGHGTLTYYIRAYNATTGCWSAGSTAVTPAFTVSNPVAPSANTFQYCEWETMALTTTGYDATMNWYTSADVFIQTGITYTPINLNPGTYTFKVRSVTSSGCAGASSADVTLTVKSNCDEAMNWVEDRIYSVDGSGNTKEIGSSKTYLDGYGNTLQSQTKAYADNQVFAIQNIFDSKGAQVLSTLPAPINSSSFAYRHRFVTNATVQKEKYSSADFDKTSGPGSVNSPNAVGDNGIGSLGWYYSSSNTLEPRTPTTSYPYSRSWSEDTPNPKTLRSASAGDAYRMGMSHEVIQDVQQASTTELDHYFKLRSHFVKTPGSHSTNLLPNAHTSNLAAFTAQKTAVTLDGTGRIAVICTTATSNPNPGVYPVGGTITVVAGKRYILSARGYKTTAHAVKLYVATSANVEIGTSTESVPTGGPNAEEWISYAFTVPAGVTSIRVGMIWPSPSGIMNDTFYLSNIELRAETPTSSPGYRAIVTDADQKRAALFEDNNGRTIATALVTNASSPYTYENWSYSYYNDLGQIVATVAPEGINTAVTTYPNFVTTYKYDHLDQVIESTSVDQGTVKYVYSLDGKLRFSQSQSQFNASPKRFSYSNYDYMGRLIESGEYTMSGTGYYVFETVSANSPVANSVLTIANNVGYTGITKKSDPNNRCTDYNYVEYDVQTDFVSDPDHTAQTNLQGDISRTQNGNATTWYSYNEFGELLWTKQSVVGLTGYKTVDYSYDNYGNVTQITYQKGNAAEDFYHHYTYDDDNRLTQVHTSFDNGVTKIQHMLFTIITSMVH